MAKAKNQVLEGKFKGDYLIKAANTAIICSGFFSNYKLTAENVEKIEVIASEQTKDTGSCIARGLVGCVLLGPLGAAAGFLGKNNDIVKFEITHKDGEKSLIEADKKISECIMSLKWQLENNSLT